MNIKTMQRVMLMFGLTFLCCSHTLASDDMNGFIAEGNLIPGDRR